MSAALHLCTPEDLDRLLPMVQTFHASENIEITDAERHEVLSMLLDGSPLGVAYLIGPRRSPVGYIAVSFGISISFGGIDGFIDEFYIRPNIRGRGMGSEVLHNLMSALQENGVKALHLEVSVENSRVHHLYARNGFRLRDGYNLMTKTF